MGERFHRSQLLLDPEQHNRMRAIASREGRSISAVARQVIEIGLEELAKDEQEQARKRAKALSTVREIRERASARYGVYEGDPLTEARSEREEDLDQARKGDE